MKTKILRQVVLRTGEGTIRLDQDFYCRLIFKLILKFKIVIKTHLTLMVFIQEIIYLK